MRRKKKENQTNKQDDIEIVLEFLSMKIKRKPLNLRLEATARNEYTLV